MYTCGISNAHSGCDEEYYLVLCWPTILKLKSYSAYSSTMNMEVICVSETCIDFQ
jgi:hypothetical protein